jgi:hypothetical protein
MSYCVNGKTAGHKIIFLLNRVLGVLKRRETYKKN